MEKWFDDVQAESEKLKKLSEEAQKNLASNQEQTVVTPSLEEKINQSVSTDQKPEEKTENISPQSTPSVNETTLNNNVVEKTEETVDTTPKNKVAGILGKFKNVKFKKFSLKGIKLPKTELKNKNNSLNKILDFFLKVESAGTGSTGYTSIAALKYSFSASSINSSKSTTSALLTRTTELFFLINFNLSLLINPSFSVVTPANMNINLLLDNKSSIDTGFTPWLSKYSLDNHGSNTEILQLNGCLLYTSPSPRDGLLSRMPSSA